LLLLVGTLAVAAGVPGAWRIVTSFAGGNILHTHPQGLLYLGGIGASHFIVSPIETLRRNGLLFLVATALVPALLLVRRHRRHALMNLALATPPILIAFNPWLVPPAYAKLGYLVHRVLFNVPAWTLTPLLLGALVAWARRARVPGKVLAMVLLVLWGNLFLSSWSAWRGHVLHLNDTRDALPEPAFADLVRYLNEKTARGAVVLSDPVTSYALSAYTSDKMVAILHQHANPNDRRAMQRLTAVSDALSPFTGQVEAVAAVDTFGVDYVVVNCAFDRPIHAFLAAWDPRWEETLRRKFGNLRDVFERVYEEGDIQVYKVVGRHASDYHWFPTVPFIRPAPDDMIPCRNSAGDGAIAVTGISFEPTEALPGEEITVTVGYLRNRDVKSDFPLVIHLRFNERSYFSHARSFPFDKIVRRYRERRDGTFRRFRVDRHVFDGLYEPRVWPIGRAVFDTFSVRLPANLGEGVYDVEYRLENETLVPNFSVRDFVYNKDSLEGVSCTELEVRRFVTR
jgi:hypothetical protein